MSIKNTEVNVFINGSEKGIIVLVPVEASKMSVVQSIKSKSKDTIKLLSIEGKIDEANQKMSKIGNDYNNLIKDYLTEAFPGMTLKYTENNKLMTFELANDEVQQLWFKIGGATEEVATIEE